MARSMALADHGWDQDAMAALEAEAATGLPFESIHLETHQGLRGPESPAQWGHLFRRAGRLGIITLAGYGISARPSRSGGITRLWVGAHQSKKNGPDAHSTKNRIEAV